MKVRSPQVLLIVCVGLSGCVLTPHPTRAAWPIDEDRVIDLTHPFNEHSIYWPTARPFELTEVSRGRNQAGRWYATNDFRASEHGGTHLDAPLHFAEGGLDTASVSVTRLMGPARVIDIREACEVDRNYQLQPRDILDYEQEYGSIEPGDIVMILTGFGRYYSDARRYLGSTTRGVAKDLIFPGIGPEAAEMLVERQIDVVGLDTASLDYGGSQEFLAHRILNGADISGLENVANLDRLPPVGAVVIALPVKIEGGTGGPCRIIAILP